MVGQSWSCKKIDSCESLFWKGLSDFYTGVIYAYFYPVESVMILFKDIFNK